MGFVDDYQRDVWRQRRLLPQYPPAGDVRVGDVMEKRDGVWKARSNLTSSGFKPKVARSSEQDITLNSKGAVTLKTKAKGSAPSGVFTSVLGKADAGVELSFTKKFGYVLSLVGVTESQMTNVDELVTFIRKTQRWTWNLSFLVVTETYTANSSTVITSSTKGSTAILKAKVEIKPGGVKVADLGAGFELAASSQLDDKWIAQRNMTPLYGVKKISLIEVLFRAGDARLPPRRATGRGELFDLAVDSLTLPSESQIDVLVEDFDPESDL